MIPPRPAGCAVRAGGARSWPIPIPGCFPRCLDLVADSTRGDPESPLRWTTKSLRHLAEALTGQGHPCSPQTVRLLLKADGYSLQAPAKVLEGARHPDRDAQFRYIAGQVKEHMAAGQPVASAWTPRRRSRSGTTRSRGGNGTRKAGRRGSWTTRSRTGTGPGTPIPYGVYDPAANAGFVNVGTDANTGTFAVASLRQWHDLIGKGAYPGATRLLVTCDAGSSNGTRNRSWKKELAQFAQDTGLEVTVCHFPPGTSKWNKVEHRLFSQVSLAWRGRPLTSYDVIICTVSAITTKTGLTATAVLDPRPYPPGRRSATPRSATSRSRYLNRHGFHGGWNYTVLPRPRPAPAPAPQRPPPPRVPADPEPPRADRHGPRRPARLAAALEGRGQPRAAPSPPSAAPRPGHGAAPKPGSPPPTSSPPPASALTWRCHCTSSPRSSASAPPLQPRLRPAAAPRRQRTRPRQPPPPQPPPRTRGKLLAYAAPTASTSAPRRQASRHCPTSHTKDPRHAVNSPNFGTPTLAAQWATHLAGWRRADVGAPGRPRHRGGA